MSAQVLLATCADRPAGEPAGELLVDALAARGIAARWVAWDAPRGEVDWEAADLVAVRSTWDYCARLPQFLDWARSLRPERLLNGAAVFSWNSDKAYLQQLADRFGVPTVPSRVVATEELSTCLETALAEWGQVVLKPRVGAGGVGVRVLASIEEVPEVVGALGAEGAAGWLVQPLVASVRTLGESSVFVLASEPVVQVDKFPAGAEVRVHPRYGGSSALVDLEPERADLAGLAVLEVAARLGADLAYARVDLMRWQGEWVVSELELIEPGLYLDLVASNAERFADLVAARLGAH